MALTLVGIVTVRGDEHARAVTRRLRDDGCHVATIDLSTFPWSTPASLEVAGGVVRGHYSGIPTHEFESIWLRRIGAPRVGTGLSDEDRQFAAAQAWAFLHGIANLEQCRWVNPLRSVIAQDGGCGKVQQLEQAGLAGLATPRTLVTTDPDRAQKFVAEVGEAIYKPLRPTANRAIYTARLAGTEDFRRVATAPCIFQELVPKKVEIRAVLCGDSGLATEIHSQTKPRSEIDFRLDYDVKHAAHELPPEVWRKLADVQRSLGLSMGVHDLILRPDGTYVYLETNQQGQWLWLQERTGQDYVGLVARYLSVPPGRT